MIAGRLGLRWPVRWPRLGSDVDSCRPEPNTMTGTACLPGVVMEGRATDGYAFFPASVGFVQSADSCGGFIAMDGACQWLVLIPPVQFVYRLRYSMCDDGRQTPERL